MLSDLAKMGKAVLRLENRWKLVVLVTAMFVRSSFTQEVAEPMDKPSTNMSEICKEQNVSSNTCLHSSVNISKDDEFQHGNISLDDSVLNTAINAYVVPVVFAVIFIVGVIGNGTLIFIVLRNKSMRTRPNIFIVSLAIGDLLLILVTVPFTAVTYIFKEWYYGVAICKLNEFLQALSLGVSVFTLTALGGDRYVAIVHPMRRHTGSKTTRTLLIAGGIWLLSICLGALELVASTVHETYTLKACTVHPKSWGVGYEKFHTIFRFIVYFALPMFIITFFYISMSCVLWQRSQRLPGESPIMACGAANQQNRQLEARKKVAKLVLSLILVFMVCWLPRHIYLIWFYLIPDNYSLFWFIFKMVSFCLCFINSCVNPLALYVLSEQFRQYYNHYLCCCSMTRREGHMYSTASNGNALQSTGLGNNTQL